MTCNVLIDVNSAHTKAEKSVPCQQCGKLFASAERVRIHIRVAHGEKSCSCEICGSGFSYRCKLLDHMRTHTGMFSNDHMKLSFDN